MAPYTVVAGILTSHSTPLILYLFVTSKSLYHNATGITAARPAHAAARPAPPPAQLTGVLG